MHDSSTQMNCTAFVGRKHFAKGTLQDVVKVVKENLEENEIVELLIFDDFTGKPIDIDFRGSLEDVLNRLNSKPGCLTDTKENEQPVRRAGRPKLGVVSGEVTLLPRQWDWLKAQPGGASVTLRKLIDEARRSGENGNKVRAAQEITYHFMTAMAGDFPQYEEALRALYAANENRFYESINDWTPDIRDYIKFLASNAFTQE
ncbi:hypothetical protein ABIE27_002971 [Paenibacillus sp. 4624]|jgi:hypothetical protein|uniref:DUF2239 family protein n=1 Tax=Paenibacillus amylolyticus TaxID=1451 RepID=A0A5M9X2F8_PAEAM|nr:DUF2239 family protein [Paenibacillus amylolyticus]KAA8787723.1 DUF2239 family protein [Paenibacillus amylolyticus]